MIRAMVCGVSLLIVISNTSVAFSEDWTLYENPRFGTIAEVPVDGFILVPPPVNGDGRRWKAVDGEGEFAVSGSFMVVADNFGDYQKLLTQWWRDDQVDVTYNASGENWFVLSGLKNDTIIYGRYELTTACHSEIIDSFYAQYPRSRKKFFDPIVERISQSLSNTRNSIALKC